ncbi:peptidyl-prolyl cis-trans isomerase d [Stylonychia lemnae]|uniref:Peptidyl-prolyl cis-trans isomerase d n=1 Tax=Stylonychia lemnae TaxID=5949 RepID=A0A078AVH2_STYLE|nr:peptidyl-prolyl cis-trans isomerase d [Stylonychia lemnae]|eukprot:CDW86184.1 peptidyl-prolyl cis-trans isomerase d [Stylonychia lemnae]
MINSEDQMLLNEELIDHKNMNQSQSFKQTSHNRSLIDKPDTQQDLNEKIQDKEPNLEHSEENNEKQIEMAPITVQKRVGSYNVLNQSQNSKDHYSIKGQDLETAKNDQLTAKNNLKNQQQASFRSLNNPHSHFNSTKNINKHGGGLFSKNNSIQSFGSHIEEFKALEEYTQTILEQKVKANELFQLGKYDKASDLYQQIIDTMPSLQSRFQNEDFILTTNVLSIYRESHMNLALSQIKMCQYESAIDILGQVLQYEPQNVKALYLRAKANHAIREYEQALEDFKTAKSLRPQDASLFDQYIQELEITINNMLKQDDPMIPKSYLRTKSVHINPQSKQIVVKEKRGGVMQDGDIQKSIDEILNLKKPRSLFSLIRMIFTVAKDFTLSLNAFILALIGVALYHYLIKRKLFVIMTFRLLDRIA